MQCSSCGFDNPEGMKFCGECGIAFENGCPQCGFENPSRFKFCGACGTPLTQPKSASIPTPSEPRPVTEPEREPLSYTPPHLAEKILTSRSALEGERKQVTVLFCDLANSTAIAERIGPDAAWLEGNAMSFGRAFAFHPVIDLLKRNFRLEEDDPEPTIIEKIEQRVLGLGAELRPILPYLRYLLAVDPGDAAVRTMDPKQRRGEIFDALRRLLLRAAEVRPQILVVEDLHWMDQATEVFLAFLSDSIPTSRVLCLFTYRPGYEHPFGERTYQRRIVLPTLSTADTMRMAQVMLATEHLPEALQSLIVQKAEGNPFFIEEVVKSLREIGAIQRVEDRYLLAGPIEDIVVPDTIQDVLMARIDRLPQEPKKTLQLASVIGREFTY